MGSGMVIAVLSGVRRPSIQRKCRSPASEPYYAGACAPEVLSSVGCNLSKIVWYWNTFLFREFQQALDSARAK